MNKDQLELLVCELMKDSPNNNVIRRLTQSLGIAYSTDPLVQIDFVLKSVNKSLTTQLLLTKRRTKKAELES